MGEIVKYEAGELEDFSVLLDGETVWLSQAQMAELFQTTVPNVNLHLKNIFEEDELEEKATIKDFLIVRQEGKRQVQRSIVCYNLDAIISVGYRIKSRVATQFRRWATSVLREHLLKGYTVKQPVSVEQLNEMQGKINEMLQRQDKTDLLMYEEFGRVYEIISEITEQKRQQASKPRRKIGFQLPHENDNEEHQSK
jgi:hypothetical protein